MEHLNHEGIVKAHQAAGRAQEVVYSPMVFSLDQTRNRPAAHLEFTTWNREKAVLDLVCAREPAPRLGGLMDPGPYAAGTGLPLMWLDKVSFCSPRSGLVLDGRTWKVPPRAGGSLMRREVEAMFCTGFAQGILGRDRREMELVQAPGDLSPGGSWVYSSGPVKEVYRITQQDGSSLAVRREGLLPQTIMARIGDNNLDILRIEAHSGPLDPGRAGSGLCTPGAGHGRHDQFLQPLPGRPHRPGGGPVQNHSPARPGGHAP